MKRLIEANCLRVALLLLCLFVFTFVGCSRLTRLGSKGLQSGKSILQLSIDENDFTLFNQRIKALGLVAVDFRPAITNVSGGENNEF